MAKTPKSVTVILGLVVAGIQALAKLVELATKEEPKEEKKGE